MTFPAVPPPPGKRNTTVCEKPGAGWDRFEEYIVFSEGDSKLNEDARVTLREYQAHFDARDDTISVRVVATAHSSDGVHDLAKLAAERAERVAEFWVSDLGFEEERILEKNSHVIRREGEELLHMRRAVLSSFVRWMPGRCREIDANASSSR